MVFNARKCFIIPRNSLKFFNYIDNHEYNNITGCSGNQATCMSGECIPKSGICNGVFDCADGSDEKTCSKQNSCEPNEFKCRNNKCVLKTWRCDGDNDCQ